MQKVSSLKVLSCLLISFTLFASGCKKLQIDAGVGSNLPMEAFVDHFSVRVFANGEENTTDSYTSGTDYIFINDTLEEKMVSKNELDKVWQKFDLLAEGDFSLCVSHDLNLPTQVDGIRISWYSSDETYLEPNGTIHRPHDQSQYVVLSGKATDGENTQIRRRVLRIERDMYDDLGYGNMFELEGYEDAGYFEYYGVDPEKIDGWFYILDELPQLYFFQPKTDDLSVSQDKERNYDIRKNLFIRGNLCDPEIRSKHEADLLLYSMKNLMGVDVSKGNLKLDSISPTSNALVYHYLQYFKGIKVRNGTVSVSNNSADEKSKSLKFNTYLIPEDFDITPKLSVEDVKKLVETNDEPELIITESEGKLYLAYFVILPSRQDSVCIDAKTGEELKKSY